MEQHKLAGKYIASTSKLAQTCRFSAHVVLQDSWFKPLKKISVDDKILLVFVKEEGGGILFWKNSTILKDSMAFVFGADPLINSLITY